MNLYKLTTPINLWLFFFCFFFASCKKDWLDAKPNKALIVPERTADYQALLDNTLVYNSAATAIAEVATDDYSNTASVWQSRPVIEQGSYIWSNDPFQDKTLTDWSKPYSRILQDNIVLEGLKKISLNDAAYNNVKGTALFYRGYDFFSLAQLFCKPFSKETAVTDLGIPLRLTANINDQSNRAMVAETYAQIIADFKSSRGLLPQTPQYKTRPSIPAVYAMLARVYLAMEDYDNAKLYADSCLDVYSKLIDYNNLTLGAARPFAQFNDEVIFDWQLGNYSIVTSGTVVPELYESYHVNDLRLAAFYTSTRAFKGSYEGSSALSNSLATDEVYLIRAECYARAGNIPLAMADLNTLIIKRWNKNVAYPTISATDATDALKKILTERRKELVFRGIRWSDLRRLNKDPRFAKTLSRTLNLTSYALPPNDQRYVFPIPQNEILASGIIQNPH